MAQIQIDIQQRKAAAFAAALSIVRPQQTYNRRADGDGQPSVLDTYDEDDEYFDRVLLEVDGDDYELPNEPLISFSRQKQIVQTSIKGGDGDIIEIIGNKNYNISIEGIVVSEDGRYPVNEVEQLDDICNRLQSYPVKSMLFNVFKVTDVVIQSVNWSSLIGYPDTQKYSIKAISDRPAEIELIL